MPRALTLACMVALLASPARAFEEPATANRNVAAIIRQLETGNWNARMHAVHELEYMQADGIPGLSLAVQDGDWQVRMTAVHALGPLGAESAPVLLRLLKHEPCPVVRLMTLHNLGSLGPEGEEMKTMGMISEARGAEINACRDQSGPGRADWARGGAPAGKAAPPPAPSPVRKAAAKAEPVPEAVDEAVVTSDPVPPPPPAPRPKARAPETLPSPTKIERRTELDAILDTPAPKVARRGVAPENLPWPVAPIAREHASPDDPGALMTDKGTGKTPYDALPGLLKSLTLGDARTRARSADDLGHLGANAEPAIEPLMKALLDSSPLVRSSAGLALGNIGGSHARVVPLLIKALRDKNEDVHYAAALALSRIDTPEARDAFNRHVDKEARRTIDRPARKAR